MCTMVIDIDFASVSIFTDCFDYSDLTVTTRHSSAHVGTRIDYDHDGRIKNRTTCAREVSGALSYLLT